MRQRKSFTLVELLVVIAIIAILLAIFLPVLRKARNKALVLACPIAYVGQDGIVYLTDPRGGYAIQISESGVHADSYHGLTAPVSWSPCGRRLGYRAYNPLTGVTGTFFHEPMSGRSWVIKDSYFGGFLSYDRFLESGAWGHNVRIVENGKVSESFQIPDVESH